VKAVISTAQEFEYELAVLSAVDKVNERQKEILFAKIVQFFGSNLKGKTFAVWGLSFKPNTDDVREAPSLVMIEKLLGAGAKVKVYDPVAMDNVRRVFGTRITYGKRSYSVVKDADALIVITEWNEFREPNYERILRLMRTPVVFDGRNIYNGKKLREKGFRYFGVGC
jgi:UDPglucose 6-dehydrogenase